MPGKASALQNQRGRSWETTQSEERWRREKDQWQWAEKDSPARQRRKHTSDVPCFATSPQSQRPGQLKEVRVTSVAVPGRGSDSDGAEMTATGSGSMSVGGGRRNNRR